MKRAGKKGFQKALVLGSDEFKAGTAQLKDLATQQSVNLSWQGNCAVLANLIQSELQNTSDK